MSASRRNTIIRIAASFGLGAAEGYALVAVCTWIVTTASLGAFLAFCMWLLVGLAIALSATPVNAAITRVLTDERIDNAVASAKGFFSRFTTKVA